MEETEEDKMDKYWENRGGWCRLGCWVAYRVAIGRALGQHMA